MIPFANYGQCPTDVLTGQNLVTNGDFSQGYTGWTYTSDPAQINGYLQFNPPVTTNYSTPGMIDVGTNPNVFNSAFMNMGDHTTGTGNMLMVDGICVPGINLWSESNIPLAANTNYYFSVWIASTHNEPNYPGILQFNINGTTLPTSITASTTGDVWTQYQVIWNSGPTPPATATISIQNKQVTGCSTEADFAIDDIAFIPGCSYGSSGPIPDLGPDQTICGKGGSIILNSNVPHNTTTTVTWNDGTSGTGLSAPYTKTITAPGTYSVCVTDAGSCIKSDVIIISNTFSINLGPDDTLCNPTNITLNAGFAGTGVTYKWYENYPTLAPAPNNLETYTVNTPSTYSVYVTDPVCGTKSASVKIMSLTASPNNGYYCTSGSTVHLSVTGNGTYQWYDTPTKGSGTLLASGKNYTTPALTVPNNYTYYVEDASSYTGSVGPKSMNGLQSFGQASSMVAFTVQEDFTILSLQVYIGQFYYLPAAGDNFNITVTINTSTGMSFSPSKSFTSNATFISGGSGPGLYTFTFTGMNISSSWGPALTMATTSGISGTNGGNGYIGWFSGINPAYPYVSNPSGVISITGAYDGSSKLNEYGPFLNWQIQAGTPCDRVPVTASYNCLLPVSWTGFDITSKSNSCILNWTTGNETSNAYFTIERSSDGIHYQTIDTIKGAGNSINTSNYTYTDPSPLSGTSYYRIGQHDINGNSSYTGIQLYNNSESNFIHVFPNPFHGTTTVLVNGSGADSFTYRIHSISGQLVEQGTGKVNEPLTVGEIIPEGIFIITINNTSQVQTFKIIKQ